MNISREQYHRFLTNQCSEEERLLFTGYLEQHPEALEQLLQLEDWEQFDSDMHLHPAFSAIMRDRFTQYMDKQRRRRKILYRIAVAAAILLIVSTSLWWLLPGRTEALPVVAKQPVVDSTTIVWLMVDNKADTVMSLPLEDHSVVTLYGHSQLRYKKVMDRDKRDLYLTGVADFEVAKDAHRPFTVYAGGVATTALGTFFKVIATTHKKDVEVKLYKGKVMVRPYSGVTTDPVYLLPGDKLTMNAQGDYHKRIANAEVPAPGVVKKGTITGGDAFTFDNRPLIEVLEQLKQRFHADIRYDTKEIKSIYITATFTQQDTLSDILTILCTLNDLQLKHTDSVFAISR